MYRTRLRGQLLVLCLTFFSYASFHITRKSFSFAKVNIAYPRCPTGQVLTVNDTSICPASSCTLNTTADGTGLPLCDSFFGDLELTTSYLAMLDTLFLFFYACGLFVAGHIVDRMDVRKALVMGMVLSSLTVFGFAVLAHLNITTFWPYAVMWSINGLIQAAGWPANVAIMGSWFGSIPCGCCGGSGSSGNSGNSGDGRRKKCGRGAIMGAWAGNASAGNVFSSWVFFLVLTYATKLPGFAPSQNGNWILAMIVSAGILLFVAILVHFFVRLPTETGWSDSSEDGDDDLDYIEK